MRIALVVPEFPTVSETFISNKVKYLLLRNHEVIVYCNKYNKLLFKELFVKNANLKIILFSQENILKFLLLNPLSVLKAGQNSYRKKLLSAYHIHYLNRYRPQIIHFEFSGIAVQYLNDLQFLRAKKMMSCRGSAEKVKLLIDDKRKQKFKELSFEIDSIHCVSQDMAETIKHYGAPGNKIYINRPAIEPDYFTRKKEYRQTGSIQILSIGRLVFQKGFVIGLLAIKDLKNLFPHFKWIIAGEGGDREELIFHIHTLGLEDHVELVGKKVKDEILKLYEESDIFFLPSVYEGIANVALEAMSMELPVVSSINGGMEEAITHNKDGMLSPNYDHVSMTEQLYELCTDFEKRKRLGEQARKTIEEKFSIKRYIDVFEQEYEKLVRPSHKQYSS